MVSERQRGYNDIDEDKGERATVKEAYHRRRERGDVTGIRSTKINLRVLTFVNPDKKEIDV